jgi:hypothetical protein
MGSIKVPGTGFLAPSDTTLDYPVAHPETAETMPFAILRNCSPQIPRNEKLHRLRRLNLAVLNPTTILPTLTARETNLPRDSLVLPNQPTKPSISSNSA